jgi:hypothetical protein
VHLASYGGDLVKGGENEDSGLAHAGLGLTDDVEAKHSLRNALVLHLGRMLETAIHSASEDLRLQKEITEVGSVKTDIVTPVLLKVVVLLLKVFS